jgi:hypothetical protein
MAKRGRPRKDTHSTNETASDLLTSSSDAPEDTIFIEDTKVKKDRDHATRHTPTLAKKHTVEAAFESQFKEETTEFASFESNMLEAAGIVETVPPEEKKGDTYTQPTYVASTGEKRKINSASLKKVDGDMKILDNLENGKLTPPQRRFVVNFCNPESKTYNDKFGSFIEAGYSAKNKNTLISNVSKLLGQTKIKEALDVYRKEMIKSKKLEISTETIDILRKRATYDVTYFYKKDGTLKPLNEIDEEWRCCIDSVDTDYKGATAQQKVVKYKLCNRDNAIKTLTTLLEVQKTLSEQGAMGAPPNMQIQAALDAGKDKDGNQGPRFIFNVKVDNGE